jgi:hypothetical protein
VGYNLQIILASAGLIAGIIGIIRFNTIVRSYRPFLFFLWLSVFNDGISHLSVSLWKTNAPNTNIYVLVEFLLLMWLFKTWSQQKIRNIEKVLVLLVILVWVYDNLIAHSLLTFNSLFRVCYSLVIMLYSINELNQTLLTERKNLLLNAKFIICVSFIIYFSYKAIVEVFYMMYPKLSFDFYNNLFVVLVFVNLFSNLMYALATAWIPTRQKFILPY